MDGKYLASWPTQVCVCVCEKYISWIIMISDLQTYIIYFLNLDGLVHIPTGDNNRPHFPVTLMPGPSRKARRLAWLYSRGVPWWWCFIDLENLFGVKFNFFPNQILHIANPLPEKNIPFQIKCLKFRKITYTTKHVYSVIKDFLGEQIYHNLFTLLVHLIEPYTMTFASGELHWNHQLCSGGCCWHGCYWW